MFSQIQLTVFFKIKNYTLLFIGMRHRKMLSHAKYKENRIENIGALKKMKKILIRKIRYKIFANSK